MNRILFNKEWIRIFPKMVIRYNSSNTIMVSHIMATYKYGLMINLKCGFVKFFIRTVSFTLFIALFLIYNYDTALENMKWPLYVTKIVEAQLETRGSRTPEVIFKFRVFHIECRSFCVVLGGKEGAERYG